MSRKWKERRERARIQQRLREEAAMEAAFAKPLVIGRPVKVERELVSFCTMTRRGGRAEPLDDLRRFISLESGRRARCFMGEADDIVTVAPHDDIADHHGIPFCDALIRMFEENSEEGGEVAEEEQGADETDCDHHMKEDPNLGYRGREEEKCFWRAPGLSSRVLCKTEVTGRLSHGRRYRVRVEARRKMLAAHPAGNLTINLKAIVAKCLRPGAVAA